MTKKNIPIGQAAEFLGVSVDTVRRWDEKGILKSSRPDGKDRYFSVADLEKVKFSQPLTISEAAQKLEISEVTLRRLESKGLIKPERNSAGERIYTIDCLENFIKSDYFFRRQEIEEKILNSPDAEGSKRDGYLIDLKSLSDQHRVLSAEIQKNNERLGKLNRFRKSVYAGLTITATSLLILTAISTLLFIAYPEQTGRWFGLYSIKAYAETSAKTSENGHVLGASYTPPAQPGSNILGKILQPIGGLSLEITKQISPDSYNRVVGQPAIIDVNDVFGVSTNGDIVAKYNLTFPDTSYLIIPDTNLIPNLNADYIRGKVPGNSTGDLAYYNADGSISGLKIDSINISDNSITDAKIQSSSNWNVAYNNISTTNNNTSNINNHISNTNNPHSVTANQVLPSQTGQTGRVLGTDGTNTSWVVNSAAVAWGGIVGVLANQGDLVAALNAKENSIAAGLVSEYFRGDKTWATLNASAVGLGSVENTALSTWVGTTNITTLGTIGTGTWNATAIGDSKISSSGNWNTAFGWGNHALAGYFVKATDDLDDIAAGITNVHLTATLKSNYDAAYSHKTTEDAINGLVKVNGAGVYSAVTDNSTNWDAGYANRVTSASGTAPLTLTLAANALTGSISDAAADGATKGISAFTATDFDVALGVVSIDYTNGQAASAGTKGFLTAADWSTFNSKQGSGSYITGLTGDVTATGPGSVAATIASGAVSLSKMANLAANTIIGNNTGAPATPLALSASDVKTLLSLNSVENTALSTWVGTTNITTLGTIGTGTWNADVIADGKIASALTGKTYNGLTITTSTGTLTIADSKTLTASNSLTLTGTDTSSIAFGTGGTVAYTSNNLGVFGSTTSLQLAGIISDETGSGALVFANSPVFTTPNIGVATGSISGNATTVTTNANLTGMITSTGNATNATLSGGTVTLPVDTNFVLSGGINGVSFDASTLSIDATNHRVGIGTTTPSNTLTINAYPTGSLMFQSVGVNVAAIIVDNLTGEIRIGSQYSSYFPTFYSGNTEAMRISTQGKIGIGVTAPTARLHLPAGSADQTTAPIKMTSGDLTTVAVAGQIEFLTDAYYGTITTGDTRKTFAFLESPTFTGTLTIPSPFTLGATSVTATGTQLNYLSSATGTTGTTSTNLVFSTSPTLVTPIIGAATATSIAIGANTLDTTEWAYLDGIDQAVKTTSNVLFNDIQSTSGYITNATQLDKTSDTALALAYNGTVSAGKTYNFRAKVFMDAGAVGGVKLTMGGTATATSVIYQTTIFDATTGSAVASGRKTALGSTLTYAGSTSLYAEIEGSIVVNGGGTFGVRFAQSVSNGTASSLLVGSTIILNKTL